MWSIAYWVPHADGADHEASPIQGFASGVLRSTHLLMFAAQLPMDIREMYSDRSDVLFSRAAGIVQPSVWPIMIEAVPDLVRESPYLLNCILSTEDMVDPIEKIIEQSQRPWLHVGPKGTAARISFEDLKCEDFAQFLRDMVERNNDQRVKRIFSGYARSDLFKDAPMSTDCPIYLHNLTTPNDEILRTLHIEQRSLKSIDPNKTIEYIDAVARSAETIRKLRRALLKPHNFRAVRHDLILAVDSLTWPFFRSGAKKIAEKIGLTKSQARIVNAVILRDGYQSKIPLQEGEDVQQLLQSPEVKAFVGTRTAELRAFTAALTLLATSTFTTTIRLNPGLNRLRGSLAQIADCARGNGPHHNFKTRKLIRRLSSSIEEKLDRKIINEIRRNTAAVGSVCLVTDMPLEWLEINGIPLSVLHDVSRVPATPGNVMLAQSAMSDRIRLGLSDFQKILVIRCFEDGDPIAEDLEIAITSPNWHKDGTQLPDVQFVDVSTVDQFVDAIESFHGAVLIFDGHGTRDKETGVGSIVIGGNAIDVWELKHRVSMPPIVLLSACDTLPVDGSHGSSAVGMLALGAVTVLCTMLPVRSRRSATFIARLIYRIAKFLPIVTRGRDLGVDWRYLMSGMLRMSYATELMDQFERDFGTGFLAQVRVKTNMDINSREEKWLTNLFRRLSSIIKKPVRDIHAWFDDRMEMADSLKYVQLGRPELILIYEVSPLEASNARKEDSKNNGV